MKPTKIFLCLVVIFMLTGAFALAANRIATVDVDATTLSATTRPMTPMELDAFYTAVIAPKVSQQVTQQVQTQIDAALKAWEVQRLKQLQVDVAARLKELGQ